MQPANHQIDQTAEDDLVRASQAGSQEAFESLLDAHLDQIRGFIALKLPGQLVNELAHDTFVFAYRHLGEFTAGGSFRAWLRAIAANLIRAEVQRFRREQSNQLGYARQRLLELELEQAPRERDDELNFLEDCIARLSPTMRELLLLKYREELPVEQIAVRLQRTQTSIWQLLFRVRQQLRFCIEGKSMGRRS